MRFSGLSEIRAYWEALRASDGAPPPRAAFDPRGIERALPQAFLAVRRANGGLGLRVVGQAICTMVGRDLRDDAPGALICPRDRAAFEGVLSAVLTDPATGEAELEFRAADGAAVPARLVLLPMADDQGRPAYVLGGLAMAQTPALPAPWPLSLLSMRLTRLAMLVSEPAPRSMVPQIAPGMAEAAAGYGADLPDGARRPHLWVVK
jgi:hypothetical protein